MSIEMFTFFMFFIPILGLFGLIALLAELYVNYQIKQDHKRIMNKVVLRK